MVERDDGSVVLGGPSGDETRNEKVQREKEGREGGAGQMRTNRYAAQVDFHKLFVVLFLKCNVNLI